MTTWQIGESGTTIALDGTGKGEVTFTVTNAGTAADRAVLSISALDGAAESWFMVPVLVAGRDPRRLRRRPRQRLGSAGGDPALTRRVRGPRSG